MPLILYDIRTPTELLIRMNGLIKWLEQAGIAGMRYFEVNVLPETARAHKSPVESTGDPVWGNASSVIRGRFNGDVDKQTTTALEKAAYKPVVKRKGKKRQNPSVVCNRFILLADALNWQFKHSSLLQIPNGGIPSDSSVCCNLSSCDSDIWETLIERCF